MVTHSPKNDNTKTNTAWNGPHRLCPHSLSHRSSSSTAAPAPRGHHKPERIGHYELLPRRLGNPTKGACPCRSARTRATPAAAAPARQRASKRHAGWLSRVWAVLRGTVRRGTQPRPHTHTHAHSYQPVCIINTYYLTYHGDGPLVPPSDLEFLYSPSAAQVALMCTPCRRQSPKRVSRNHMAYPKGTNQGHIIYLSLIHI